MLTLTSRHYTLDRTSTIIKYQKSSHSPPSSATQIDLLTQLARQCGNASFTTTIHARTTPQTLTQEEEYQCTQTVNSSLPCLMGSTLVSNGNSAIGKYRGCRTHRNRSLTDEFAAESLKLALIDHLQFRQCPYTQNDIKPKVIALTTITGYASLNNHQVNMWNNRPHTYVGRRWSTMNEITKFQPQIIKM